MKIMRFKNEYCTVCYILYLPLRKLLHRIRAAQTVIQVVLKFLSAINLDRFSYNCKDLICFENSFKLDDGWRNMERIFSAVHLPTMGSKNKRETAKKVSKISAAVRVFGWIDAYCDTGGEKIDILELRHQE